MSSSHTLSTYPLHRALHEHKIKSFFELLESENGKNIHQRDCFNRTLLGIAAANGQVKVALTLLAKKADVNDKRSPSPDQKTPLYLAIEHDHLFLAHILLMFGADKTAATHLAKKLHQSKVSQTLIGLKPNKEILCALFFWVIWLYGNKEENEQSKDMKLSIIKVLISRIQAPSSNKEEKNSLIEDKKNYDENNIKLQDIKDDLEGLIELTAHLGYMDLTEVFYKANNSKFRVNPASPTTAYWAAENGYRDFYEKYIVKDDQLVAETLRQLTHKNPIAWELATPKQIQAYENLEEVFVELKQLTKRQNKILIAAKWINKKALLQYVKAQENILPVLVFAYQKKEFVAFKSLMEVVDYRDILQYALTNNLKELFFILSLLKEREPYKLACENILNTVMFDHIIPYQSTSILNRFILHACSTFKDTRSQSAREKQATYFKSQNITVNQFVRSYCFLRFKKEVTNKSDLLTTEKLTLKQKAELAQEAKKLGFEINIFFDSKKEPIKNQDKFFNLFFQENSPFHIIRDFLDEKSIFILATTSTHYFKKVDFSQNIETEVKGLSEYLKKHLNQTTWMERLRSQPFSLSCTLDFYLAADYAGGFILLIWLGLSVASLMVLYQMIECSIGSPKCSIESGKSFINHLLFVLSSLSVSNLFIPRFSRANVAKESYFLLSLLLLKGFDEIEVQNLENFVANFNTKTSIKTSFHQLIDKMKKAYRRFNIHHRLTVKEMKHILSDLEKEISPDKKKNLLLLPIPQAFSQEKGDAPSLAVAENGSLSSLRSGFFEIKSTHEAVLSSSSQGTISRRSTIPTTKENDIMKDDQPAITLRANRNSFG